MAKWSHGYNVSSGYTYGFYRETSPDWIDLALAVRGFEWPQRTPTGGYRYLELGSGQGFGLCLLAGANPEAEFLGIDFSPAHTAHANSLAHRLGLTNVRFVEGDFAELGRSWPDHFGQFQYVVLHGIYSWVPEEVRRSIVSCLAASVAPGGAVYLSYNSMPGWLSTVPFQHILRLLNASSGLKGMDAIDAGRALFEKLHDVGSGLTRTLPALKSRIESTSKHPSAYLVQEYLHDNWHPMWCSQVMSELGEAKLDLVATATMSENLLPGVLPSSSQEVLADQRERHIREDLVDCLINQSFRRDLYSRGARTRFNGDNTWLDALFFRRVNASPVPSEIEVPNSFGKIKLTAKQYAHIFGAISEDSASLRSLSELPNATDLRSIQQILILLVQLGWLGCSRTADNRSSQAGAFNRAIARMAAEGAPYRHLVAPALGSAVTANDSEILLLNGYHEDPTGYENDPGGLLRDRLARLGRKLAKGGKALSPEDESKQLKEVATAFEKVTLPVWKRLGVI